MSTGSDAGSAGRTAGLRRALAAPLLLAVALQNVGNLLLHALLGRTLPPESYGALGTVLALMVLLTVPLGALQAAAGAAAARDGGATSPRGVMRLGATAAVIGLMIACLAPLTVATFHLDSSGDAAMLGPFVSVSIVLAVLRGRLLGVGRVGTVALTFVVSVVVRLVVTVAFLGFAPVTGALVATLVGEVLALVVAGLGLRGLGVVRGARAWLPLPEVGRSALVIGSLFLFTTIDLFLARALLPAADSGAYVAAATIGKTLLALPAAALAAAYPRLVASARSSRRPAELRRTAIVVCGLAGLGALVVAAVPGVVLAVLYGGSYPDAGSLVALLAGVAALSSVVSLATYGLLAVRSWAAMLPLAGAALEAAIIGANHDGALAVAAGSAAAAVLTSAALAAALVLDVRSDRAPTGRHSTNPHLPRLDPVPAS